MQPETVLGSWRDWNIRLPSRPVLIKPLSGGRSNQSFLLDSAGMKMVLRINGSEKALPNPNRRNEIKIWQAASDKGIAPPLLHVDEQDRFLVSTYIENKLPANPRHDEKFIEQALGLLNQCHLLPVKAPNIDYASHIEQYWQIIEGRGSGVNPALLEQREPMRYLLRDIINSNTPTGLCHHDPVVVNFVGSSRRLYLIDWEYAAQGMLVMDYAALGVEWQIGSNLIIARTGIKPELMTMATDLYRYLCELWEQVTA